MTERMVRWFLKLGLQMLVCEFFILFLLLGWQIFGPPLHR